MKLGKGGVVVTTSVILIGFLLAAFYFALAIWLFPHIDRYTPKLEQLLSETMHARVTIKRTTARWQGITPYFSFDEVTISGKTKLSFARIDAGLALWRLPQIHFAHLALVGTDLSLWRDREKRWYLAGASLDAGGDSPLMRWLLQQGKISFQKTTLFFEDRARQLPSAVLKTDDFFWKKKYRAIVFAGHFDADPTFATKIGVQGLWKAKQETLAGAIHLSLLGLDAARLENPWLKNGKGDAEFDLQGDRENLSFKFSGNTRDIHLKLRDKPPLSISQLSGRLLWQKNNKNQKIVFNHFEFAVPKRQAKPLSGEVMWNNEHGKLEVDHLDVSTIDTIVKSLPLDNNLTQRFTASGALENIDARWQGPMINPQHYHFSLTAANFSLAEKNGEFGVTHLFGNAHGNEKGGSLNIASASTVNLAQTFAKPLHFEELVGTFLWGIDQERFNLSLENTRLRNKDFHGKIELHYYHRPSDNELVLDLDLKEVVLANVVHYLPRNSSQNLKKWLAQSLIGGSATELTLHVGGDLDRFPFTGEKPPGFFLNAQLVDATLAYSPAWPMLTGIDGILTIENEKLSIQARKAEMGHLLWHDLEATIANYTAPQKALMVKGESQGDGHIFVQTLFATPLSQKLTALEPLKVSGPGTLKLALDIDLDNPDETKSQGEYRFTQTTIAYGKAATLQQASGALFFKDNHFTAPNIEGFMFGGKSTCALKTLDSGDIQLDCHGLALAENLKQAVWPGLPAAGQTAWTGTLTAGHDQAFLHIDSNLQGLRLNLPDPIQKDDSEESAFNLDLAFRQQATQWRLRYAKNEWVMDGEWWTDPKAPGYKITRGIFRINDNTPPPPSGLWISGNLDHFTVDDWFGYFTGDSQNSGFSPNRIRLNVKKLEVFHRVFAQTTIEATLADEGVWRIHAHGPDLLGELSLGNHLWQARLARLNIGTKQPYLQSPIPSNDTPTSMSNLDIDIQEFIFEEKNIGSFALVAKPKNSDIIIEQLKITNPDGMLSAQGLWKNWRMTPSTDWKVELKTDNLGNLLQRYGMDGQVVGGEGSITGQLHFPEPPYAIDFTEAQGNIQFEFRKGRLTKLNTGIFGRLLGLVRIEALPRRFMLNFSDLFEKGFTFDLLKGESKLGNQKVTIADMVIAGPPGGFFVSGHVDLAQKGQSLIVRFVPASFIGDGLAIGAGILGGPAAGFGAFILQKALGDPLGRMLTLEYQVSGTWADPKVQPLVKPGEGEPKDGG